MDFVSLTLQAVGWLAKSWVNSRLERDKAIAVEETKARVDHEVRQELQGRRQELQLLKLKSDVLLQQRTQEFQLVRDQLEHTRRVQLQQFVADIEARKQRADFDFRRWQLEEQKRLQWSIELCRQGLEWELAHYQRQSLFASAEFDTMLENFPLLMTPSQIVEGYEQSRSASGVAPLLVLIAPPEVAADGASRGPAGVPALAPRIDASLRRFLGRYGADERPVTLLDGAWKSKRHRGGAAAESLFSVLRDIPTVILESNLDDTYFELHAYFWMLGQRQRSQQTVLRFKYKEFLQHSARARAELWGAQRQRHLVGGRSEEEIAQLGGADDEFNLRLLRAEELGGDTTTSRGGRYRVSDADLEELCQFVSAWHCVAAGWMADLYHLLTNRAAPLLPSLVHEVEFSHTDARAQGHLLDVSNVAVALNDNYKNVLESLSETHSHWVPDLSLALAAGLARLPDPKPAVAQLEHAVAAWLELRQLHRKKPHLDTLLAHAGAEDLPFLRDLKACLQRVGRVDEAAKVGVVSARYARLAVEKRWT